MGAVHEDTLVQVALRADEDNALVIQCRDYKEACNQATYYRRAYARVIKKLPSVKDVEIRQENTTIILTYTPFVQAHQWLPRSTHGTPSAERSNVDPSGATTPSLTQEQERFVKLLREDYEDGEISSTGVIAALDEADIPKEVATWL